jgi:peptidoglycan hydrolase-like amidase
MRPLAPWLALLVVASACSTAPRVAAPPPQPAASATAGEAPAPTATPTPRPVATPTPTVVPPAMGPVPTAVPAEAATVPVRILLERTDDPVALPQPGRAWAVTAAGPARWMWGPLTLEAVRGTSWWQVGAFSDAAAVAAAKKRLESGFGSSLKVTTRLADTGLTRIRVRWAGAMPGDAKEQLAAAGFADAFPVPAGGRVRLVDRTGTAVEAEEIRLQPGDEWPSSVGAARYHGSFRARVSGGQLLVINHLDMETYLKGVVPVEMGPSAFPQLDALKAQAVAARTYAAAHLGDHDDEGYDLCDTPACQVYGGADVHHRLSDRAVEETAGLVLMYEGAPIDAMFTSTSGGHTEDAAVLFPPRAQPYLTGVPTAWERELTLSGSGFKSSWMGRNDHLATVAREVLGLGTDAAPAAIMDAVAAYVGRPVPVTPPTLEGRAATLLDLAGLDSASRILTPEDDALSRLLFLADLYHVPLDPPVDEGVFVAAAALAVLELRGDVVRDSGELVPRAEGAVGIFPTRALASETLALPAPIWERWNGGFRRQRSVTALPGTTIERLRRGDRVVAVVVVRSGGDGEADRRSAWREWVREKPWSELAQLVGIPDLVSLEVTQRSKTGRVVGLAAIGRSGSRREWSGFEIRRVLELPENLFSMQVVDRPGETRTVRFLGRAWGHGVGMCQNGAYGLARSGMTFDRILAHFYRGAELRPIR